MTSCPANGQRVTSMDSGRIMNNCTLLNTGIPRRLKKNAAIFDIFLHQRNSYELIGPSRIAFTSVLLPSKLFHPHDLFINGIVFSVTKPATKGWPTKWTCKQQAAKKRTSPAARFFTYMHKQMSTIWIHTQYIKLERWRDRAKMEVYHYIPGIYSKEKVA